MKLALEVGDAVLHVDAIGGASRSLWQRRRELWRVQRQAIMREADGRPQRPPPRAADHEGALCAVCGARKKRKGGRNAGHRFICAGCV